MKKYLQNRIATSRWALPITGLLTVLVWLAAGGMADRQMWLPFALLVVTALAMVQLNNRYSLIRIYSRMVSCSFLIVSAMCSFSFSNWRTALLGLMSAMTFVLLFRSYQDRAAQGWIFFAFVCIGVGSMAWIQMLLFVPLAWIVCAFFLYSLTPRAFVASILGLLLPYWFWFGALALTGNVEIMVNHFSLLLQFRPLPVIGVVGNHQLATLFFIVAATIISSIHFAANSYQDKIRTRTFYSCFLLSVVYTVLFIILQPQFINELTAILVVSSAPVLGHFLALSNTKLSNACFFALITLSVVIVAYNLWTPSQICF